MKNFSVWSQSRLELPFLPGAGADLSRSEPEPESAPGPWWPGAEPELPKKVAAPQHWFKEKAKIWIRIQGLSGSGS